MKKNDIITENVIDYGSEGEGVIKTDNFVVFLPFSIKGEKVKCKILKTNNGIAFGKLEEIITPSCLRVESKCSVFKKCGGCQLQHVKYEEQLKIKEDNVKKCFLKIANLNVEVLPTVKSDKQFRYRNKLQLPVRDNGESVDIGFYANNSHRVIPITDCPINPLWTVEIIKSVKTFIQENKISCYNEQTGKGLLKEITVKEVGENLIITAIINGKKIQADKLVEILKQNLKQEFSLYVNTNESTTNVIYGDKFTLVYGKPYYEKQVRGIKVFSGVRSFMQVNDYICDKLYEAVEKNVLQGEDSIVIDAYSGAGLMTAILSQNCKKAIGIEVVKEAVDCANELAKQNGLEQKMFSYEAKCEDVLEEIVNKEENNGNVSIVIDPPRKGCDIKVINAIIKSKAKRIVYVSCKPSSLARDIGLLIGSLKQTENNVVRVEEYKPNYKIMSVQTFDMFPETKHVETLCVLEKI